MWRGAAIGAVDVGWASRVERGMPRAAACSWVRLEVGTPTMSERAPDLRRVPSLSTTTAAVEPVPRPRTMPLLTYWTALSAASFFRSSWVRTGAEALIEEENLMRLAEGEGRRKERDREAAAMVGKVI